MSITSSISPGFYCSGQGGKGVQRVDNGDFYHVHGACDPIIALSGQRVDALVVGGIGGGALMKLNAMGVRVYEAGTRTVKENLALWKENKLQKLSRDHSCRTHECGCGY